MSRVSPGHEVVDAALGMAGDEALEDVGEVGVGIDAVQFAGFDQRGDDGPVLGALVGAGEERVLTVQAQHEPALAA